MPQTLGCTIGFQKNPVVMRFAMRVSTGIPDEHIKIYRIALIFFKRVGLYYNRF